MMTQVPDPFEVSVSHCLGLKLFYIAQKRGNKSSCIFNVKFIILQITAEIKTRSSVSLSALGGTQNE